MDPLQYPKQLKAPDLFKANNTNPPPSDQVFSEFESSKISSVAVKSLSLIRSTDSKEGGREGGSERERMKQTGLFSCAKMKMGVTTLNGVLN